MLMCMTVAVLVFMTVLMAMLMFTLVVMTMLMAVGLGVGFGLLSAPLHDGLGLLALSRLFRHETNKFWPIHHLL